MDYNKLISRDLHSSIRIALKDIHACSTGDGLIAGPHHFVDVWARDGLFATFGTTAIGQYDITKRTIETFIRYMRADGLAPYRVMRSRSTIGKYFGKPSYIETPRPNYYSHQSGGLVPDGGLLVVIAAAQYFRYSKDRKFIAKHYASFKHAMDWYGMRFHDELASEWFQCEWADAVLKSGTVLYTNVLYVKAIRDLSYLASIVNKKQDVKDYKKLGERMGRLLMNAFWNGTYFSDWIDYKRQDYFASHANFLAIMFGLVDEQQARLILAYAEQHALCDFTLENNYPKYPFWRIPLIQYIAGIPDYHNRGCLWLQPGITYALALWKDNHKKEAREFMKRIANQIVKYDTVYEVYEKDGSPVHRLCYRSEGPFAWSAGLFLFAVSEIFGLPKNLQESPKS